VIAHAAISWLCEVLGFTRHQVFEEDGVLVHAELTLGGGLVMLASTQKVGEFSNVLQQPDALNGATTQAVYVQVVDVAAVYARAAAAGAPMVIALKTRGDEGRGFTCKDLEGHVWSVSDYNPWLNAN
jgi:uncharacterized glyoxalase superfamily protein PhnB